MATTRLQCAWEVTMLCPLVGQGSESLCYYRTGQRPSSLTVMKITPTEHHSTKSLESRFFKDVAVARLRAVTSVPFSVHGLVCQGNPPTVCFSITITNANIDCLVPPYNQKQKV